MTQEQPQVPALPVVIPVVPVPQQFDVKGGEYQTPDGTMKVAYVTFTQPMCAFVAMLDLNAWNELDRQVREQLTGISVVRQMPPGQPGNGHGDVQGFRP